VPGDLDSRSPITGFGIACCCARAASGHVATPPKERDELASFQISGPHGPHRFEEMHRILPKLAIAVRGSVAYFEGRGETHGMVCSWHTASIRCGAKVRTRSERSGHAESVGSG
jgi:hypothetical protein